MKAKEIQQFAQEVNKSILNEVSIFEEVVIYTYCDEIIIGNINVISEYNVALIEEICQHSYGVFSKLLDSLT